MIDTAALQTGRFGMGANVHMKRARLSLAQMHNRADSSRYPTADLADLPVRRCVLFSPKPWPPTDRRLVAMHCVSTEPLLQQKMQQRSRPSAFWNRHDPPSAARTRSFGAQDPHHRVCSQNSLQLQMEAYASTCCNASQLPVRMRVFTLRFGRPARADCDVRAHKQTHCRIDAFIGSGGYMAATGSKQCTASSGPTTGTRHMVANARGVHAADRLIKGSSRVRPARMRNVLATA